MDTLSTRIPNSWRQVRGRPQSQAEAAAIADLWTLGLGERHFGDVITNRRSSWVRKASCAFGYVYVKTYEYSTWASRIGPTWRSTGPWKRSRAAAEYDAMQWMQRQGLPTASPLAVWEQRRFGWLTRAILLTAGWPGQPLESLLATLPADEAERLAAAVGMAVARLHLLGFRDRNLDARNLLARRTHDGGWMVAKIDSPRHRLRSPGLPKDRAARADWQRLLPQFPQPKHREVALLAAGVPERQRSRLLAMAQQQASTLHGGTAP